LKEILECIDRGLDTFGVNMKQVVYYRIQTVNHLNREEIVQKPLEFVNSLADMFGSVAVKIIEKSIVREIAQQFKLDKEHSLDLVTAIKEARLRMAKNRID